MSDTPRVTVNGVGFKAENATQLVEAVKAAPGFGRYGVIIDAEGDMVAGGSTRLSPGAAFTWQPQAASTSQQEPTRVEKAQYRVQLEEDDVLSFVDASSQKVEPLAFYLDPGLGVTRAVLEWLSMLRLNHDRKMPQRPLVISGPTKSGKSFTLNMLLPALINTCGVVRPASLAFPPAAVSGTMSQESPPVQQQWSPHGEVQQGSLPAGGQQVSPPGEELQALDLNATMSASAFMEQPAPGVAAAATSVGGCSPLPALPSPNIFHINCMEFERSEGLYGFMRDLYTQMRSRAQHLGLPAGFNPERDNRAKSDKAELKQAVFDLLNALPGDTMNVFVLDEAQCFFLLAKSGTQGAELGLQELQESRRFFKALISSSPHHCAWAVTGSTMAMIWANVVETPVNGLALETHMCRLEIPARVSVTAMAVAWRELNTRYSRVMGVGLPAAILAECLPHYALLAFMCEQWYASKIATTPYADIREGLELEAFEEAELELELEAKATGANFVLRQLEAKVFPEVLSDLRLVLNELSNKQGQLNAIVELFDPLKGVSETVLGRTLKVLFEPYLRRLPGGNLYVDSVLYHMIIMGVITRDGKLQTSPFQMCVPAVYCYRQCALRHFGELCGMTRKKSLPAVKGLLADMATSIDEDKDALVQLSWFRKVLQHPDNSRRRRPTSSTAREAFEERNSKLDRSEVLGFYHSMLRNCISHAPPAALVEILDTYPLEAFIVNGRLQKAVSDGYLQLPTASSPDGSSLSSPQQMRPRSAPPPAAMLRLQQPPSFRPTAALRLQQPSSPRPATMFGLQQPPRSAAIAAMRGSACPRLLYGFDGRHQAMHGSWR